MLLSDGRGRGDVAVLALTQAYLSCRSSSSRDDVASLVLRSRHHVKRVRISVGEDRSTVDADEDALKLDL